MEKEEFDEAISSLEEKIKSAQVYKKEYQRIILEHTIKVKKLDKKIANLEKAIRRLEYAEDY